jgi:GNAT superfamily N-acetyltransferase
VSETPFAIVPATPADVPAVAAMIRRLAEYERLSHLCVATEEDLEAALFGPRPAADVLIARIGAEPAGFALFFHNFSTFLGRRGLWLEDLFVYPRFRGVGLGKALLRAVAQVARERGCARFEWAVLDWNGPAIRFYEGLGATVMPDWRIARVVGPALEQLAAPTGPSRSNSPSPKPDGGRTGTM